MVEKLPGRGDKYNQASKMRLGNMARAAIVMLSAITPVHAQGISDVGEVLRSTKQSLGTLIKKNSSEALPYISLLAHGLLPDITKIKSDPALTHVGDIDPRLVAPLVMKKHVDESYWKFLTHNTFLLSDVIEPDSGHMQFLRQISADYKGIDPTELGLSMAYVARNIYFKNDVPRGDYYDSDFEYEYGPSIKGSEDSTMKSTESTRLSTREVRAEVAAILERREDIAALDLFRNRDVLLLSNNESGGVRRFGPEALERVLRSRVETQSLGLRFNHIKPSSDATEQETSTLKKDAEYRIRDGARPLTVFFDGHGNERQWSFTHNVTEKSTDTDSAVSRSSVINVVELARAIAERWATQKKVWTDATEVNLILIFSSCYSQNYIRNLAEELTARGIPLPQVMISSSEFGAYSASDFFPSEFRSKFNELIVKSPTMGDFLKKKSVVPNQTPSTFVPRKEKHDTLMQLGGIAVPMDAVTTA